MTPTAAAASPFRYDGYELEAGNNLVACRYSIGAQRFTETITFEAGGDWEHPAVDAAARWVFLLAGVSYFKTLAPTKVDLGNLALTGIERRFLRAFYVDGLGEFAYRNGLRLSDLELVGPTLPARSTTRYVAPLGRPLVPFGGGIDSIVTAEHARSKFARTTLFVVSGSSGRFDAIERPAAITGLPVVRAERALDQALLTATGRRYLNGHVPVTGIISAMAVMAAVLFGHDAVVMSNEWSASIGNLTAGGVPVNHQYSKSLAFETGFRAVLEGTFGSVPEYFSLLRPFSELWVARRFAELTRYHGVFRSCNRAFRLDASRRLDRWCGVCDKCCFIDLILSPFMSAAALGSIFDGVEPLENPDLTDRFRTLLGTSATSKPFECVGDVGECRAAVLAAADRPDRAESLVRSLAAEVVRAGGPPLVDHQRPMGEHWVPDAYATEDQLV